MGTGLVALATLLLGSAISVTLTRSRMAGIAVATVAGLIGSVLISTVVLPVFALGSPNLPGALLRLSIFILPFILAAAALGKWLRS